jgi:hypothetical protein
MIPTAVPAMSAEIVRSVAAAVELPTVTVRVAAPRFRRPETEAPRGLPVEVYVTPPPRVRVPAPVVTRAWLVPVPDVPPSVREPMVSEKPLRSRVAVPAPLARVMAPVPIWSAARRRTVAPPVTASVEALARARAPPVLARARVPPATVVAPA